MDLEQLINNRTLTVSIVGMGYVGLPLAIELARKGCLVYGIDVNCDKINSLCNGVTYIDDITSDDIEKVIQNGKLIPTCDFSVVAKSNVVVICVPTPFGQAKQPDMSFVTRAGEDVGAYLKSGSLVILESTTYPGATNEVLLPVLEEKSGLEAGNDFYLAFSPERIDPGNKKYGLANTCKVVGGINVESAELAKVFYSIVTERTVIVSSTMAAEMVKLYENTFRHVNIAFANEMAKICDEMGLNIWEIIDAAATKPFGFMPFYPGPGVGGHCIAIDPVYLAWRVRDFDYTARFVELATQINESMPYRVVGKIGDALNKRGKSLKGSKILVLGVAYKKNVSDVRESPSLKIIDRLVNRGAKVVYFDPYVPQISNGVGDFESTPITDALLHDSDCAVIATDHSCVDYEEVLKKCSVVVDTRNALKGCEAGNLIRL